MNLYKKYVTQKFDGVPTTFTPGSINFEWCCDCSLRHVTRYSIGVDDDGDPVVIQRVWRDDHATGMQRREARRKKARKR